jgi:hypothetical protein
MFQTASAGASTGLAPPMRYRGSPVGQILTKETAMNYSIEEAANTIRVKPEVVKRAIELGAIRLTSHGLISLTELSGFAAEGFKHNRYDREGNKLPGVKS